MRTASQKAQVESSYQELLGSVPPEVAERLRAKYEEDVDSFSGYVAEHDPSAGDPTFWAKKSCKKCYGRGIIGKRHLFTPGDSADAQDGVYTNVSVTVDMSCSCGKRRREKWLAEARRTYNLITRDEDDTKQP